MLLAVLPFVGTDATLALFRWPDEWAPAAVWTVGLSALLGLVTWKLGAATPAAAATGAAITTSLMFSTLSFPYEPWHTALIPILAVFLLAFGATKAGRLKKERLGTAQARRGRTASQVAANLGMAALVTCAPIQWWVTDRGWLNRGWPGHALFGDARSAPPALFTVALAALAEAAADTVSSEIGQVLGGRPRMITTFRTVDPGTDGATSIAGTLAGVTAAAAVAGAGAWSLRGDIRMFAVSVSSAVFGLFFDSLLGATLERQGWINNDSVNFLSTAGAAAFAIALLVFWR